MLQRRFAIYRSCGGMAWKFKGNRNNQVKDNKIDLLVQQYEEFVISEDEFVNSAFARFNTIITSLKALNDGYSSKNYVRKFLRALRRKWRAKVTTIKESKDLTSLSLDELIGNLKVHEIIIKKDSKIVKAKVDRKSLALKAKKECSDEQCSTSASEDEEYVMATFQRSRDDKNGKSDRECFRYSDPNHLIGECLNPLKDKNQRAFVRGSWSDSGEEDDENVKEETCLVAQASNEICLGVDLEPDEWIKDSECSKHMMGNRKLFSTYKAYNGGNVIFSSNLCGNIIGKGMISNNSLKIDNVERVDNLGFNLLSIGQICNNKCKVTFSEHDSEIIKDGKVIGRGIRKKGLYVMKLGNKPRNQVCLATIDENYTLWHRRLGYANMRLIQSLVSKELVRNLPKLKFNQHFCDACKIGKQAHTSHKAKNIVSTTRCLELLHMDLFSPSAVWSYEGNGYTLVIVDDYSSPSDRLLVPAVLIPGCPTLLCKVSSLVVVETLYLGLFKPNSFFVGHVQLLSRKAINKVLLTFNSALLCAFSSTIVGGITVLMHPHLSEIILTMLEYR
uniref:Retrovirus-related Pol polyprotein from transposon TNT 1-94 n=1 Tax=Tanacetum cinerariifolium TaxID=118510 RepID=A0A6L2MKP1_TANCI|nr:retrovirus-related Pol polyprotein from transposon TNT 1-94 [Tanacetum cinerariifolium]